MCLSDRNPTWPLEHTDLELTPESTRLSDRNPTWPLEPYTFKVSVNGISSQ